MAAAPDDRIRPPLAPAANAATPRSISAGSRESSGLIVTLSGGVAENNTASCAMPVAMAGSRSTRHARDVRRDLLEQLQPFAAHAILE